MAYANGPRVLKKFSRRNHGEYHEPVAMNVRACRGSTRACDARYEAGLCRAEGILWLTRELRCERTAKTTHPNPWMDYGREHSGKRYYERPLPRSFGGLLSSYDLRKDS